MTMMAAAMIATTGIEEDAAGTKQQRRLKCKNGHRGAFKLLNARLCYCTTAHGFGLALIFYFPEQAWRGSW